jgi:hypothetical protein
MQVCWSAVGFERARLEDKVGGRGDDNTAGSGDVGEV